MNAQTLNNLKIVIKGAGEMASGIAHRLYRSGMTHIAMTEIAETLCVRRMVSFSEAVYDGEAFVDGVKAERVSDPDKIEETWKRGAIAVLVDPQWHCIEKLKPDVVVDAIMAKKNLGTKKDEASLVIGVGPGFTATQNVHVVVESNRGHNMGRVIADGSAEAYTGVPGQIMGVAGDRVMRAPITGAVRHVKRLGDLVKKGEHIMSVGDTKVFSPLDGVLRGLIREMDVTQGEKIGDVDPRGKSEYCGSISEKARAIGGGVLEAIMSKFNV